MIKAWMKKRAEKKAEKDRIESDKYLTRLNNSSKGFMGTKHYGDGPFLSVTEVHELIRAELKRQKEAKGEL